MSIQQTRLAATARHLEAEQLEALIAFNGGQNSFLEGHAVFVLSGVKPIGESAVLVDRAGASTLIVTPAWDAKRAAAVSQTDKTVGSDDLPQALAAAVKAHGINPRKAVSVALSTLSRALVAGIETAMGGSVPANDKYARELARIRTPEELEAARRATAIAERGYARFLEFARPGVREFELAAELYGFMKGLGAEDNFLLLSASQHNLAVTAAGARVLDVGDIILSEITPCYQGQFAQICRTTVIGEPPALLRDKYAVLQEAMRRGQAAAVPGASVRTVTEAIDDCIRAAGYGEYCRPPYMRVRGHGLGITSDAPGDITVDNETRLEDGMVFVMHPNQYLPETGYLMCGEPVVITPTGAKALTAAIATLDSISV
ncbi:MAG TPA: Xaa-Pro peptidase family protein [Xanthobacteraceae bacterium]|nr:Xaa-Pro peptidase family protein [Xanthobacteraceae bacterium]